MRRTSLFFMMLGLILGGNVGTGLAVSTWYVAPPPAGSDDNDGTSSWAQAFATISNAVARAAAPDTILLTNGTHGVQAEVYVTNGITIQGFGGRDGTFVTRTGAQSNRIFRLDHAGAVLDGLTISNGYLTNAPGVGVYLKKGTIRNCTITRNYAFGTNNTESSAQGIGVYMANGVLTNCMIAENYRLGGKGDFYGGGVYATAGKIQNCQIVSNSTGTAGGVYLSGTLMENCDIISNYCSGFSGGAYIVAGATIRNCVLQNNRAGGQPGGMQVGDWGNNNGYAYNCLVVSNRSGGLGGGIEIRGSLSRVQNCTIVSNLNGGVHAGRAYEGQLQNCIVYYNAGGDFNGTAAVTTTYTCASAFLYSDPSNITNEPKFVNPADNDYHLKGTSPCHDRGTTNVQAIYTYDLDYVPHKDCTYCGSAIPDMGCYENNCVLKGTIIRFH